MKRLFCTAILMLLLILCGCGAKASTNILVDDSVSANEGEETNQLFSSIGISVLEQDQFFLDYEIPLINESQLVAFEEISKSDQLSYSNKVKEVCELFGIKFIKNVNDFWDSGSYYYALIEYVPASGGSEYQELVFLNDLNEIQCLLLGDYECNVSITAVENITADMSQSDVIELLCGGYCELEFPDDYSSHLIKDCNRWYVVSVAYEDWKYVDHIVRTL